MNLKGQLHVLAALTPGKNAGTHWIRGWVVLTTGLDFVEKRKIPCHTVALNPDLPVRSIVTILSELPCACGITDKLWTGKNLKGICRLIEKLRLNLLGRTQLMGQSARLCTDFKALFTSKTSYSSTVKANTRKAVFPMQISTKSFDATQRCMLIISAKLAANRTTRVHYGQKLFYTLT